MTLDDFLSEGEIDIEKMIALLSIFRELRPDMSVGTVQTFLSIAIHEGKDPLSITDLSRITKLAYPTVARHCDILGPKNSRIQSLGLIKKETCIIGNKSRYVSLSDLGRDFLTEAIEKIYSVPAQPPSWP